MSYLNAKTRQKKLLKIGLYKRSQALLKFRGPKKRPKTQHSTLNVHLFFNELLRVTLTHAQLTNDMGINIRILMIVLQPVYHTHLQLQSGMKGTVFTLCTSCVQVFRC